MNTYTADLFRCILRLEARADSQIEEILMLKTKVDSQNEEIVVLKTKVDSQNEKITSQNEKITSQNEEITVLQSKVDTLERIAASHDEEIVVLKVMFIATLYILHTTFEHYHQEHLYGCECFFVFSPIFRSVMDIPSLLTLVSAHACMS